MKENRAKEELDDPIGKSCSKWTVQDKFDLILIDVLMDPASAYSTGYKAMELFHHIASLRSTVPFLRQMCLGIGAEEGQQEGASKEIQRLKEDLSGLPCAFHEMVTWIRAQNTEHMDELRKLLDKQFKEVCRDFLRVSQNPDWCLFLNSMLSNFEGPWAKCVSDVHDIIGKIIKHLQGKRGREMISEVAKLTSFIMFLKSKRRQEISEDEFLSMVKHGVHIGYSPNRECLELNVTKYSGTLYFTRLEWHTSVRNKLVQLLLFLHWSDMKGHGYFSPTLQPQEVKDPVCFVSRTSGDTTGGIVPSYAGCIPPVGTLKKRRRYVVTTGSSDTPVPITGIGRRLVTSKKSIDLFTGDRIFRLLDVTRRRRRRRRHRHYHGTPTLWIYDTGSSISVTGDLSLLRGVHDAHVISSAGVSGAELVSNKCGRISGAVNLSGVRYFPGAKANLISAGLLGSLGCETIQNAKGCKIMKYGQVIGGGRLLPNRTYSVDFLDDKLLGGDCPYCQH